MHRALENTQPRWHFFYMTGMISWLAFLIMSVSFYQERALFTDSAYQLFQLIQSGQMEAPHHRFGNYLVQLFPWLALKLQAPLSIILLAFSISYPLVLCAQWLTLWHYYKQPALAMAQLAALFLLAQQTPFVLQSGLYLSFGFLLMGFAEYQRWATHGNEKRFVLLIGILAISANLHPLNLLTFGLLWSFFWWAESRWKEWRYYVFLALFLVLVWLNNQGFQSAYEAQKVAQTWTHLQAFGWRFWELPAYYKFFQKCLGPFVFLPLGLLGFSGYFLFRRTYWGLAYLWLASFTYLLLIHYSSPNTSYPFYAEIGYLPLALILALPFFYCWQNETVAAKFSPWVFTFILLTKVAMIGSQAQVFSGRINWMSQEIARARAENAPLVLLHRWDSPEPPVLMNWATPYESLLYSSLSESASVTLWVTDQVGTWENGPTMEKSFCSSLVCVPLDSLNQQYFSLLEKRYVSRRLIFLE